MIEVSKYEIFHPERLSPERKSLAALVRKCGEADQRLSQIIAGPLISVRRMNPHQIHEIDPLIFKFWHGNTRIVEAQGLVIDFKTIRWQILHPADMLERAIQVIADEKQSERWASSLASSVQAKVEKAMAAVRGAEQSGKV